MTRPNEQLGNKRRNTNPKSKQQQQQQQQQQRGRVNYQSITAQREAQLRQQLQQTSSVFRSSDFGVRFYDLEPQGGNLDDIVRRSELKARYNEEAKNYTQLIEQFEFKAETSSMALSKDGNFILATGGYPPQMKCFELEQLSMKFERHCDNEIIKILPLTDDFRKFVMLHRDRWLEFHAQFGRYYNMRLPREGRDMVYHEQSSELMVVGSAPEIYRFDLEQGIYRKPMQLASQPDGINCIAISPADHQLFAVGCDNGYVECFDPRTRTVSGVMDACQCILNAYKDATPSTEITQVQFDPKNPVLFAAGTDKGHVGMFDLRKYGAIMVKDHHYDTPIRAIRFHDLTDNVISADDKVIKIWDKNTGDNYLNIEFPRIIHDVLLIPDSGMIMCAGTQPGIKPYYVPSLGPAPRWCSFVDNITEELEEVKKLSVQQDFKFVTLDDLDRLGLASLVGSTVLRPYMHGFFMKMELYKRAAAFHTMQNSAEAAAVKQPSNKDGDDENGNDEDDEDLDEAQIRERVDQRWSEKRITAPTSAASDEAMVLQQRRALAKEKISTIFSDDRFKKLLSKPEFQINETKKQKTDNVRLGKRLKEQETLDKGFKIKEVQSRRTLSYRDTDNNEDGGDNDESKNDDSADTQPAPKKQKTAISFAERLQSEGLDQDSTVKRISGNQELVLDASEVAREDRRRNKQNKKREAPAVRTDVDTRKTAVLQEDTTNNTVRFNQKNKERRGAERMLGRLKLNAGKSTK